MRLLTLDFLNVNSLGGHWHIDFTSPEYRRFPLFAITGSTGTGKSSILDAVSLALYGETPRVKNSGERKKETEAGLLQKDSYDDSCPMLTKGTKEIRAGVRFEAGGRFFSSSWRRYVKRTGTLSPAQVELIEYTSSEDTQGRLLTTKTTEWHKLVAEVTKMTFETFTRSVLLAQGAFSNFLKASDDARAQILEDITGTEIYSDMGRRVFRRWAEEVKKTEDMRLRLKASAPMSADERLALEKETADNNALLLTAEEKRRSLTAALTWRRQTDEARQTLAAKERALQNAEKQLNEYRKEKLRAEKARAALEPLRLYRDSKIIETENRKIENELVLILQSLERLKSGKSRRKNTLREAVQHYADAKKKADAFAGPYRSMIECDAEIDAARERERREAKKLKLSENQRKEVETRSREADTRETLARQKSLDDDKQFAENRADDEIEARLDGLSSSLALLNEKNSARSLLQTQLEEKLEKISLLEKEMQTATRKAKNDSDKARTLKEEHMEARRIYETARDSNSPETALEAVSAITARMSAAGEASRLIEDRNFFSKGFGQLQSTVDINGKLHAFLLETQIRFDARLEEIEVRHPGISSQVASGLDPYLLTLEAERCAIIQHTARIGSLREAAEITERRTREAEEKAQFSDSARVTAETAFRHEGDIVQSLRNALITNEKEAQKARTEFIKVLEKFPESLRKVPPEVLLPRLKERARSRRAFLEQMRINREMLSETRETAVLLRRDVDNARRREEELRIQLKEARTSLTQMLDSRNKRFGDMDPNQEKRRLTQELTLAQAAEEKARKEDQQALAEAAELTVRKEEVERRRADSAAREKELLIALEELMKKKAFADLETLLAAELPESTIEAIEREVAAREENAALLSGQKMQAKETLKALEAQALSIEPTETLIPQADEAERVFLALTRKSAELSARINADDLKREANARNLKAIENQEAISAQWDRLRQLIGSADGKIFRTAAQKITFRILLQYANEAMETMTGRYWLHAAGEGGLSVDVVDNDMGGQIRTSKNLSGGESFLVSLALALGLSRMGGKNLRVDTLFLDEGFGTLDEATLNNALYALENLQASSGKLIGIISHVKNVKERIQNHITVSQRAGSGLSSIRGPGVTRLPDD